MMRPHLKIGSVLLLLILFLCVPFAVFAQAERGAGVPLQSLPEEIRNITPRDHFIPSSLKKVGSIQRLEGNVVVIHQDGQAYFGAKGDPIYEKDTLVTLASSKCRIRFADEDVITMASETEFSVEALEDERGNGRKSSFFRLVKGKVAVYALRLFRYRDIRFTLATPTNTIGVRGTKFGVHVHLPGGRRKALPLTDCFCVEGLVDVDGRLLSPGQMFEGRTGKIIPTPPEVIRVFQEETEFGSETRRDMKPGPGEWMIPHRPFNPSTGADIQEEITGTIQDQTGRSIERGHSQPSPTPPQPAPSPGTAPDTPNRPSPPTVGR